MKTVQQILILAVLWVCNSFPAFSQNSPSQEWNQFRGPNRNGSIDNISIPDFNQKAPKLLWKKALGESFSSISISNKIAYTLASEMQDSTSGSEYLIAMDIQNGKELWRTQIDSLFFDTFGNGPRSTPAVDSKTVYCLSSYGKLVACNKLDGKIIWQIDFKSKYQSKTPRWAFSSSPAIVENHLIVEVGGTDERAFVAFDKTTGREIWKRGNGNAGYNSPAVAEIDGQKSIIFANGKNIFALNTKGDTIWTYRSPIVNPTSMPLVFDGNKLFISAVRNPGFIILEIQNHTVSEFTRGTSMKNDFSSSLYHDGYIYGFNVAALQCISATTGEVKWTKRGFGKGSLIRVGNYLLVLSDKGKLIQVKATPDSYNETGNMQAIEGKSWTAPSFSDGKLFIRNLQQIVCYQLQ